MLTREMNELLTRVGPGTACGELMRRYWQPAALSEELPPGGAPISVRLLGEDLVLFRDHSGDPGLLGIHCSHRGADLSYGRVEDGGLRRIYHGWLYDREGRCLEQPGEPAGSTFHEKIRHRAYPCLEAGGLILTYMGPGDPPLLPAYPFLQAPDDRRFTGKLYQECNYLQANEGNYDPIHPRFLHVHAESAGWRAHNSGVELAATVEAEETDYGMRLYTVHRGGDRNWVRATNFILPNLSAFPGGSNDGYSVNWHVAIDDEHHWKYVIVFRCDQPLDHRAVLGERSEFEPGYRLVRNGANRYLQPREEMKSLSFAGLGKGFQAQDALATESQGPIQNRTQEHLVYTDKPIVLARLVLLKAIQAVQEGKDPPHVLRPPASPEVDTLVACNSVLPASVDWHRFWESSVSAGAWKR